MKGRRGPGSETLLSCTVHPFTECQALSLGTEGPGKAVRLQGSDLTLRGIERG